MPRSAARGSTRRASISACVCSRPVLRTWYSACCAFAATSFAGSNVWNFTASAPASAATSTSACASATSPLWFTPASAMTKHGRPMPISRVPILTNADGDDDDDDDDDDGDDDDDDDANASAAARSAVVSTSMDDAGDSSTQRETPA